MHQGPHLGFGGKRTRSTLLGHHQTHGRRRTEIGEGLIPDRGGCGFGYVDRRRQRNSGEESAVVDNGDTPCSSYRQTGCEGIRGLGDEQSSAPIGSIGDRQGAHERGKAGPGVGAASQRRVGDRDETGIRLSAGQGEGQALGATPPDSHALFPGLPIPEERYSVPSRLGRGTGSGADQDIAAVGAGNHSEVLALCCSDYDYLVHGGMGGEGVGRSHRRLPAYQDSDLQEGSTGLQASSVGALDSRRRTAITTAARATTMTIGEKRFTATSLRTVVPWHHPPMSVEIDHVILRVDDLDRAAKRLGDELGLASVPGGHHPGHGTANRIVPLGDNYLELVAVVDPGEAAESKFGRWVASGGTHLPSLDALCLRSDDLGSVCDRLGLEPFAMGRKRPDGVELRWRLAGLDKALEEGWPFFMQWDVPPELLPGRTPVSHPCGARRISEVVISGDVERLRAWIGEARGTTLVEGPLGVAGLTIETSDGEITLGGVGS